jgi:hypothetical protein
LFDIATAPWFALPFLPLIDSIGEVLLVVVVILRLLNVATLRWRTLLRRLIGIRPIGPRRLLRATAFPIRILLVAWIPLVLLPIRIGLLLRFVLRFVPARLACGTSAASIGRQGIAIRIVECALVVPRLRIISIFGSTAASPAERISVGHAGLSLHLSSEQRNVFAHPYGALSMLSIARAAPEGGTSAHDA